MEEFILSCMVRAILSAAPSESFSDLVNLPNESGPLSIKAIIPDNDSCPYSVTKAFCCCSGVRPSKAFLSNST